MIVLHPGTWCCFPAFLGLWEQPHELWLQFSIYKAELCGSELYRRSQEVVCLGPAVWEFQNEMKAHGNPEAEKKPFCVQSTRSKLKRNINYMYTNWQIHELELSWTCVHQVPPPAHAPRLTLSTSWFGSIAQQAVSSRLPLNSVF